MTSLTVFEAYTRNNPHIDRKIDSVLRRLQLHDRTVVHTVHDVHEVACHSLVVDQLENVEHPEDAKRAKLRDNLNLRELRLSWNHADRTESTRDAEVLENLVPPRTLEGFQLDGYQSKDLPEWMLKISSNIPYLTTIQLTNLACDALPPLGMLPNLRLLRIEEIPNIKKIGKEFYGEVGACKKLRVIIIRSLENLEEWWTTQSGEEEDEFLIPNLHKLDVWNCPKLKFVPYPPKSMYWDLLDSDEVLPPKDAGFGRLISSTLPFDARISSSFTADTWGRLQHLSTLEGLTIHGGTSLPETTPCFPSLRKLYLQSGILEKLPEWLGQLNKLEELIIAMSPKLTTLPESIQNLTALKKLSIMGCRRLVEWCNEEEAYMISISPIVEYDRTRLIQAWTRQPVRR